MMAMLIKTRFCYSFNHETDGHNCGLPQSAEPPCRVDQSAGVDRLRPGDVVQHDVGAPGYGFLRYRVTRVDSDGAWGVRIGGYVRVEEVW